jgi:uncharacterized membrane protein
MNSPKDHRLVSDYLKRFDTAARKLEPLRRARLREEIASHLREATTPTMSDDRVLVEIDALGPPDDIVAEELTNDGPATPVPSRSRVDIARLLLAAFAAAAGVGALIVMLPSAIDYLTAPGLYFSAFVWTLGGLLAVACVILAIAASRHGHRAKSVRR